jgi:SAM-dependent methyltransferase
MTYLDIKKKIKKYLNHGGLIDRRITYYDLKAFAESIDGSGKALIVFAEFEYDHIIKDFDAMPVHIYDTDKYLEYFKDYEDGKYDTVVCSGLLEHMKDPDKLIENLFRVLKPGGKAYVSASCVFSVHRGPENYFHITHFGARLLFERQNWSHLNIYGSCGPFRTMGINCQRILLQSDINILVRPFIELLSWSLPLLDVFVRKQYDGRRIKEDHVIDSMMPSNIQIIATR